MSTQEKLRTFIVDELQPEATASQLTDDYPLLTSGVIDSIGIYRKGHLVRMYSIYRTTGDVVDFMRGCQVFRFDDIKRFQAETKQKSHAAPLTDQQLAAKVGCPKLTVVNSRWVH